ncbi:MAG: AAA family ATPase [Patescibacteria group bacterium]
MRITEIAIKNYRSFDPNGQTILFPTLHCALVGKNNSGKSNIIKAFDLILGAKNPSYIRFEEDDYFDTNQPIEIKITIGDLRESDKSNLLAIPNLTKQQKGALFKKISDGSADIIFLLRKHPDSAQSATEIIEEIENTQDAFEIHLWGFNVHRKKDDVRKSIVRMLIVPAIRDYNDELSASRWTHYGQLMKEVLENSSEYRNIKEDLSNLNLKIQSAFKKEKQNLLKGARVVSYVDDISFQLTKENNPSELLRNLEIFVKEGSKSFNIKNIGTGTQSAIIIGILELALKNRSAKLKLFGIEEPEVFIHPHGIRYLSSLIRGISEGQNTQIIISTHSLSLTANFEPREIILVGKRTGKTVIKQDSSLAPEHYRRFVHQDNAEIFFSDRIILIEGPTEKHLLCNLDKATKQTPGDPKSDDCNFDRINVGIIRLDSVDSICNYIKIVKAFGIPFAAMVDRDFLSKPMCQTLCTEQGIVYQATNQGQLISDLKSKDILVNTKGEIEDLFPDQDIAVASGRPLTNIQTIKSSHTKTSTAFKKIFQSGKTEYAIKLVDYYIKSNQAHPLEDLIQKFYANNISGVIF